MHTHFELDADRLEASSWISK